MAASKTENRIWYFDFLRIIACVSVIVFHVVAQWIHQADVGTSTWMVFNGFDTLSRWAVPVFVMISGALFLAPERSFDFRVMLKKNLLRLVTAFVFWSALYAVVEYLQGLRLRNVALHFISGGVHLWFLYMLGGLYLLVPLLRRIASSEKATKYFLLLWFLFSIVLDSCKPLVSYLAPRYSGWVDTVTNNLNMHFVYGFTGYFLLGYYLHHYDISKKARRIIYALGGFGAVATFFATYLISKKANNLVDSYYSYFALGVFFETIAVFVFFKYHAPNAKDGAVQKLVGTISKCSFGIYLVHFLFVKYSAVIFRFDFYSLGPLFAVPLLSVIVFVCSFVVSWLLNKIPVVKNYLV